MTDDSWKSINPRDCEPEDGVPAEDFKMALWELRNVQAEATRCREALRKLFCVVKALSCSGGISTPMLRHYLRTHPALRDAADALGTDRLDDKEF